MLCYGQKEVTPSTRMLEYYIIISEGQNLSNGLVPVKY